MSIISAALQFMGRLVTPTVEYLVIGGASGGFWGGGAAGGFRTATGYAVTPGAALPVTVGAGSPADSNGSNSVFDSITSLGGGLGRNGSGNGGDGGSGGGGGSANGLGGTGTVGQGHNGGRGHTDGATFTSGGAGAGSATNGSDAGNPGPAGTGGNGTPSSITGTSITYARGAGAVGDTYGDGANGIGSSGANTGSATLRSSGDSGVVIIRYPNTYPDIIYIGAGLSYTFNNTGGYKIYKFTAGTDLVIF